MIFASFKLVRSCQHRLLLRSSVLAPFSCRSSSSSNRLSGRRRVSSEDLNVFDSILADVHHRPGSSILQDAEALESYNTDFTQHWKGQSKLVLKPSTTEQVSAILAHCNEQDIAVVPQGGNTGLVGGSVPVKDEVILSTERLNEIYSLNDLTGVLRCQAGCILQDLQDYCSERNHLVPVDLGAKGSCQIGGNLSTNAGGQYYYRYGSLAGNLLGLQVVLADGSILNLNYDPCTNLKDNTGYKLQQLFVGAEGTLGVITGVSLLCPRLPVSKQAAFLACTSYDHVLAVLHAAKNDLGEILAALEWMDRTVVDLVSKHHANPLGDTRPDDYRHYVLVETHGSNADHDRDKMETFLEHVMTQQDVVDGVVAQDLSQLESFWEIRESTNPIVASTGYTYKYDISLPVAEFEDFMGEMQQRLADLSVVLTGWGHVLDGNLHFNVFTHNVFEKNPEVLERLEPYLFELVLKRGGSISAEHGLGQAKNKYLYMVHDKATLQTMRSVKDLFDPKGILNPDKFLPSCV